MSGDDLSDGAPLDRVCQALAAIAPLRLAESWDNVGLLVGDRSATARRVMTCLTITPDVVDEAIERSADLIVAHHPLPFKPLVRITTDSIPGEMLWRLIGAKVAVYSAHTAFDSAAAGINQTWAEAMGLESVQPLMPIETASASITLESHLGAGRRGKLPKPMPLHALIDAVTRVVTAPTVRWVGDRDRVVSKVAFACGSGGSFLPAARRHGVDVLVTGEATFHTCLDARSSGLALVLTGHYYSERFAMERMATTLADEFAALTVWASERESDPLQQNGVTL